MIRMGGSVSGLDAEPPFLCDSSNKQDKSVKKYAQIYVDHKKNEYHFLRESFAEFARNPQFSTNVSRLTIQVSKGNAEAPQGTRKKDGDSIGVVHRHESSPADELGRCHPDRWMFCKVLLSCNSAMRYGCYQMLSRKKAYTE